MFIGVAGEPVTYHFSGEAFVEEGRQNLRRAEAHWEQLKAQFDSTKQYDPTSEAGVAFHDAFVDAQVALVRAFAEFGRRQAMTVPPYDLTLVPMVVGQALKSDTGPVVMVRVTDPRVVIQPGERYGISGARSTALLPPFPHMGDVGNITEYVDVSKPTSPDAMANWMQSLLTSKGASLVGTLRMQNFGDGIVEKPTQFRNIRVIVSSGKQIWETITDEDGKFSLTGLTPGRLQVRPVLPEDLTVTSESRTTVNAHNCSRYEAHLEVNLNGRVRGRVTTAAPLEEVKVSLQWTHPDELRSLLPGHARVSSHTPHVETSLKADGTFELYGVPPGWYALRAHVPVVTDGKRRSVTTYYPGTPHMAYATPLEIGKATVHEGFDFVVAAE
jgi:hypothetical protein